MRILIISDIHANITAFDAVLEDAKGDWDVVWCLGDVVGSGPDPNKCIERLRELPHLCLAGNHDWAATERLDIRTFNPDARHAVEWVMAQLTPENRAYLEDLPVTYALDDYTLVHASPREPVWEFILEPLVAALNFPHFETPTCFFGHTHQAVIYELMDETGKVHTYEPIYGELYSLKGKRLMINPGSVGFPTVVLRHGSMEAYHHTHEAMYGILDTDAQVFEYRRARFDIESVMARIEGHGLSLPYGWRTR